MFEKITNRFQFKFKDRVTAANILGKSLKDKIKKQEEQKGAVVLGIPRGGVVTADIVAKKLSTDNFDIVIPRKLTDPDNKEQAIGAIMEDGTTYLDKELISELSIPDDYIEQEKAYQIQEIKRRSSLYRKQGRLDYNYSNKINGKVAIIVDDGAATGATIIAAARWLKKNHNPKRLIIAIPVAPKDTIRLLKEQEADGVEVITTPSSNFKSVGQFYHDFTPVADEKVREIMLSRNLL
jgi:putative phosphoribosyl transferase